MATDTMAPSAVGAPTMSASALLHRLIATSNSVAPTVARLGLGLVMFAHGAQKALGWFGGPGFSGTIRMFHGLGIPAPLAVLDILAEFLGAIALVAGLFTRLAATGIAVVMVVAIATVHARYGFFMNWTGTQKGQGFEYHLLALAMAVSLMVAGGGRASIDGWLDRRYKR
jgi:putative oxidoreductase